MKQMLFFSLFVLLLSDTSFAQIFFTASLDGSQSVPAVTTSATGTAWAVLGSDMKTLTYRVTYANLSSAFLASHFHYGAAGTNGSVVEPIDFSGNTAQGTWTDIPDSIVTALLQGRVYINIHSTSYSSGEIRGQLTMSQGVGISMSLDGSQDVPALAVDGTGTGYAVFNHDTNGVTYRVTIAGLSSDLVGSHFHYGAAGTNGPVIFPISFVDSTASGLWVFPDSIPLALAYDSIYVNVHTSNNMGGEIRGQFTLQPSRQIVFTASLNGSNSVPPVTTNATASGWAKLDLDSKSLSYRFTYANLSSAFLASHFHSGSSTENGPVIQPVTFVGNTAQGKWTNMPDAAISGLLSEGIYLNIHSTNFTGGEIRSQLKMTKGSPFSISLDGSQDVPPLSVGGSGSGWAYLDSTGDNLVYQLTVAGLSSNLVGSHFHIGASGVNGVVVDPITVTDSTSAGIWSAIPDSLIPDLMNNDIYANIHTTNNTGGEIRGQLIENGSEITAVSEHVPNAPRSYSLSQNYPNPFNPTTIIGFSLPQKSLVKLEVFNVLGEKIATLVNGTSEAGSHFVEFNGERFASGVYFYRLTVDGSNVSTHKMILLK